MKLLMTVFFTLLSTSIALAQPQTNPMQTDPQHIQRWNHFFGSLVELHQQYMQSYDVYKKESTGGYAHQPNFYREVYYYDKQTNRLLSRVLWEQQQPGQIHLIEVFVYDEQGRVDRDYLAAYLPGYRNAPIQTLINLHQYSGELHSYRQFDASGNRIYEHCEQGKRNSNILIQLEEDGIALLRRGQNSAIDNNTYRACFAGLEETAINYLQPF